jgi:hypothetical protein
VKRRILELHHGGFYPESAPDDGVSLSNPLDDMRRLADAVVSDSRGEVSDILEQAGARLQEAMLDELHRLVGTMLLEIGMARSPRGRLGRAIAGAARLIESRPSDNLIARCADPLGFVEQCRVACHMLVQFTAGALDEAIVESGGQPPADLVLWVRDGAHELHEAMARTASDGMDRKVELALSLAKGLQLPREPGE